MILFILILSHKRFVLLIPIPILVHKRLQNISNSEPINGQVRVILRSLYYQTKHISYYVLMIHDIKYISQKSKTI